MIIFTFLGFIWNTIFYNPVVNLLVFSYKYLGGNLGLAIILVTILIRLLLWPMMKSQIMAQKRLQDLKPKLDALKSKYKNDKRRFQEEQLKLYRESGVNPAGSCLPLLIQIPFIYALYIGIRTIASSNNEAVFNKIVYIHALLLPKTGHFNVGFLGINLAKDAAVVGTKHLGLFLPYILVAVLVGVSQYFVSKLTLPITTSEIVETTDIIKEEDDRVQKGKVKKKKTAIAKNAPVVTQKKNQNPLDPDAFSKTLSTQMLYLFPIILVWFSLGYGVPIPAALSIYWIVQSVMMILQTLILQKKLPWMKKN
jgi:YidC/Oxa1 family membrane protein insertase